MLGSEAGVGIASWGCYLPRRSAIKRSDHDATPRTAAAWDEDSFTMALEAGRRCLDMHAERRGEGVDAVLVVRPGDRFEAGDRSLATALGLGDEMACRQRVSGGTLEHTNAA